VAFQKEVHVNLVLSMPQGKEKFHLAPLCNIWLGNVKNGASVVPKSEVAVNLPASFCAGTSKKRAASAAAQPKFRAQ
jgi:hypothetical protein